MQMIQTLNRMSAETVERLDFAVEEESQRGLPTSRAALVRLAVIAWLDERDRSTFAERTGADAVAIDG